MYTEGVTENGKERSDERELLPVQARLGSEAAGSGELPRAGANGVIVRVLVVEDDSVNRAIVKQLLHGCGYEVVEACDGREAIKLLSRGNANNIFSLVLCDIMMPNIDGKGVLSFIRGTKELKNVPVVMMSALEQTPTVFDCIKRGADDYILKPVTRKEVKYLWQHVWRRKNLMIQKMSEQGDPHNTKASETAKTEAAAAAAAVVAAALPTHGTQNSDEPHKRKRIELEPKNDASDNYSPSEMREYCERQIKKYQRILKLLDENPQLLA